MDVLGTSLGPIGGPVVTPSVDPCKIMRYIGEVKRLLRTDELVAIVSIGVSVGATVTVTPT